jgi:hypothetical protein
MACRFARLPLVVVGGIQLWNLEQSTEGRGYYDVHPHEATGVFTPYCNEHKCCCDVKPATEFSGEVWICPGRPDELSAAMKAELIYERSLKK